MLNARWSMLAVAPLLIALSAGEASAQLSQPTTFSSTRTAFFTKPWYPSSKDSVTEFLETNWAEEHLSTSITRATTFRTAPNAGAGATLPLYVCSYPGVQVRKTVRPYSGLTYFYNHSVAAYHSHITKSHGEFLSNAADCQKTGATSRLLGYVVSPSESAAYLKTFGGSLDPIVSCATYGTATKSTFGAKDYELDSEVCSQVVFAGLSTGFTIQQTASQTDADRYTFPLRSIRMQSIRGSWTSLFSTNYETVFGGQMDWDYAIAGFNSTFSFSNTSGYNPSYSAPTAKCAIDATFDPAAAASLTATPVTAAGACVLSNLVAKLAKLEGPIVVKAAPGPSPLKPVPAPVPAPAPAPVAVKPAPAPAPAPVAVKPAQPAPAPRPVLNRACRNCAIP